MLPGVSSEQPNEMMAGMQGFSRRDMLVMLLMVVLTGITVLWGQRLAAAGIMVRQWDWRSVAWLLPGVLLAGWQVRAGLPPLWPSEGFAALWRPWLLGMVFGVLDILVIKVMMHPQPYDVLPPFLQPFPYSIALYGSGALSVETWYRMVPITLVMLAVVRWASGRYASLFWVVAILSALREPLEQWPSGPAWFVGYAFVSGFAMNLLQATWYRKTGFAASLALRLGHYLWWHILLSMYMQYVELA